MNSQEIIKVTLQNLKSKHPSLNYRESKIDGRSIWKFPHPPGADYSFEIECDGDQNLEIRAVPVIARGKDYFWYLPFEGSENISSTESVLEFERLLASILLNKTRIIQKRELLFWSFELDVFEETAWKCVYSHSGLRFRFNAPQIDGKERIYFSESL